MKTQEIKTIIGVPRKEVFEFTVEPKNTPKWIDTISKESINTDQIGIGTVYTNDYGTLTITDYDKDVFIEFTNEETGYQCSYSYRAIDDNTTELVYFEYMQDGSELSEPMERKHFEKLKTLLENN